MSAASDVFNSANQENRTASAIASHFADPANLKMVQQHMTNAANQDNRVERNTSLPHFPDNSNLKMVQLSNMGALLFFYYFVIMSLLYYNYFSIYFVLHTFLIFIDKIL